MPAVLVPGPQIVVVDDGDEQKLCALTLGELNQNIARDTLVTETPRNNTCRILSVACKRSQFLPNIAHPS